MRIIAISSCFFLPTRYDGKSIQDSSVAFFLNLLKKSGVAIVPFCPERLGGLPIPRAAVEIQSGQALTQDGKDLTQAFDKGAQRALELLKQSEVSVALVKQKSPSCGFGKIYDGNFSGTLIPGEGVTSRLLHQNGIKLYTEEDLHDPYAILETHFGV